MNRWNAAERNNVIKGTSRNFFDSVRIMYDRVEPISKLHIIQALDNGQSKSSVAREYGIIPQTVAYIYKHRDTVISKYAEKYKFLKEVHCTNLDQTLSEWLQNEVRSGNMIDQEKLRDKTLNIMSSSSEEFSYIDDWLLDFRLRHNIEEYLSDTECTAQSRQEWVKLSKSVDPENLYFAGVCSLSFALDFDFYVNGLEADNYVSILFIANSSGLHKKELAVYGKETLEKTVKSLPVKYYNSNTFQLSSTSISNYLINWNDDLKSKEQHISLVMSVPECILRKLNFSNIKIINSTNMNFVTRNISKILKSIKFHYRRLQLSKKYCSWGASGQLRLLDYIYMMSSAWHNVSNYYIEHLFFPPQEGSLYIKRSDENEHSLTQWCLMHNVAIDTDLHSTLLEEYILCDNNLQTWDVLDNENSCTNAIDENIDTQPQSGIEAFEAIKRLINYLQSENAGNAVITSSKNLENQLEHAALGEIHQFIEHTNGSDS